MQDADVMASTKHFVGNEQETNRMTISSNLGQRALHEMYVRPFADLVKAGTGSIMSSYNLINNTYASENTYTLNKILKDELGFQGFVVSDWGGTHSGIASFTGGQDVEMPGSQNYNSGLLSSIMNKTVEVSKLDDMATRVMAAYYKANVDRNRIKPNFHQQTDQTYSNLYPDLGEGPIVKQNEHKDVRNSFSNWAASETAKESVILLKNVNNTLPLNQGKDKRVKSVAVLGQAAGTNSMGPSCTLLGCVSPLGMADGAVNIGWGSGSVLPPYFVTPVHGIEERAMRDGVVVNYNVGEKTEPTEIMGFKLDAYGAVATPAEYNLVFTQANGGEQLDRTDYDLELEGEKSILAACEIHKNNIVIVNSVGQVDMSKWIDNENVTAVVFAPPLGQDHGKVLAEVLFGDVNPSGKLPFTIAKDKKDYVQPTKGSNISESAYPQDYNIGETDIYVDYRYFDKKGIDPLFEFGYGLSYSEFKIDGADVDTVYKPKENLPAPPKQRKVYNYDTKLPDEKDVVFPEGFQKVPGWQYGYVNKTSDLTQGGGYKFPDDYSTKQKEQAHPAGGASGGNPELWKTAFKVHTTVKNTGSVRGAEVAQLYIGYPTDKYENPPKQLRGFDKVTLNPGESKELTFDLLVRDLAVWDAEQDNWVIPRGEYKIYIGNSSRNTPVETTIKLD